MVKPVNNDNFGVLVIDFLYRNWESLCDSTHFGHTNNKTSLYAWRCWASQCNRCRQCHTGKYVFSGTWQIRIGINWIIQLRYGIVYSLLTIKRKYVFGIWFDIGYWLNNDTFAGRIFKTMQFFSVLKKIFGNQWAFTIEKNHQSALWSTYRAYWAASRLP